MTKEEAVDCVRRTYDAVTPEMIEAGCRVLGESGITDELMEWDSLLVERIYRAMVDARKGVA